MNRPYKVEGWYYRGYMIEYLYTTKEWVVYRPENPQQTVAYYDGEEKLDTIISDINFEEDERWQK